MKTVILLNKSWMPIHLTSVENAMTLIFTGKAKPIDSDFCMYTFEEWVAKSADIPADSVIKTVSAQINVPKVIVASNFNGFPIKKARFSSQNVHKRDKYTCAYCKQRPKKKDLTLDHVIPKSQGGKLTWGNAVTACKKCNGKKADRTPEEAGMPLSFEPKTPKWIGGLKQGYVNVNDLKLFA